VAISSESEVLDAVQDHLGDAACSNWRNLIFILIQPRDEALRGTLIRDDQFDAAPPGLA